MTEITDQGNGWVATNHTTAIWTGAAGTHGSVDVLRLSQWQSKDDGKPFLRFETAWKSETETVDEALDGAIFVDLPAEALDMLFVLIGRAREQFASDGQGDQATVTT